MPVMATATYNEVYNTITQSDGTIVPETSKRDPMFHWDTHFPERMSRLTISPDFGAAPTVPGGGSSSRRAAMRNRRNRCAARFKTQPITFDEIKEVDEEGGPSKEEAKENLKSQFTVFSRSIDGLVVSPFSKKEAAAGGALPKVSPLTVVSPAPQLQLQEESDGDQGDLPSLSSDPKQIAANKAAHAASAALQRQQFRQRRKKRHTKSIEEAPELDRIENIDT